MTSTYKGRRDKGIRGEREVMRLLQEAGFEVRGLEGRGDHLALKGMPTNGPLILHVETKRQETLRPDEWSHQAETEAPLDTVPIVVYRRNNEPWRVLLLFDDYLRLLP